MNEKEHKPKQLNTILLEKGIIMSFAEGRRLIAANTILIDNVVATDLFQLVPEHASIKIKGPKT